MELNTLQQAIEQARQLAAFAKSQNTPTAFEVVKTKSGDLRVQPFGMHTLFKTNKLLHVEPIPKGCQP